MESNYRKPTALKAHLALNVANINASVDFYRRLFGIEPGKVRIGYAKFDVQNPPLNLTLNEAPAVPRGLGPRGLRAAGRLVVPRRRAADDEARLERAADRRHVPERHGDRRAGATRRAGRGHR